MKAEAVSPTAGLDPTERQRLSRAIHDDVMQGLAACVIAADLGQRFCAAGRSDDALEELQAIRAGLDQAMTGLREILNELRIPA